LEFASLQKSYRGLPFSPDQQNHIHMPVGNYLDFGKELEHY
jgi:hypothetical protein